MKKSLRFLAPLLIVFLWVSDGNAQISIIESMDGGVPGSWSSSGYFSTTSTPCEGTASVRDNLYSFSTTGFVETPNTTASNGTDISVSYDWQATEFGVGDGVDFTVDVEYSLDQGGTYTSIGSYGATTVLPCTQFSTTIPGAIVPVGSDFQLRITADWVSGDNYHWIDNVSITQVALNPPNCDAALTSDVAAFPIGGSLTWSPATGAPTFYGLQVGSTPGGSDIVNEANIGLVTSYDMSAAGLAFGTTYYATIVPANANGPATGCTPEAFTTEPVPPTGAICELPLDLGTLPYTATGQTTSGFLDDYSGSPGSSCGSTSGYLNGDDIVYSYTSDEDGSIAIELTNIVDNYTGVFVYNNCSDIGSICADGAVNGFSAADLSLPEVSVTNGQTIYIVVSTWASPQTTTYDLSVIKNTCSAPTATFAVVSDCAVSGGFVIDVDITDLGTATSLSVSDGAATMSATGAGIVTMGPYTNGTNVTITVTNDQDNSCEIMSGSLTQAVCPPANDDCATAEAFGPIPADGTCSSVSGSTEGATNSGFVPSCDFAGGDFDVFYSFVAPAGGSIVIEETLGTASGLEIVVLDGCGGSEVASSCGTLPRTITGLTSGVTYIMDVWNDDFETPGTFDLCIKTPPPPPANDECANATMLDCGVTLTDQTTVSSVSPDDPIGCASDFGVWYTFMGAGVEVTVSSTAASGYDHELDIFSTDGGCAGAFTQVVCDDGAGSGGTETHTFTPDAGVQYFVYVAHFSPTSSVTGEFDISLDCACDNPVATVSLEGTCPTYSIDVDLASLGGATSVDITNDVNGSEHIGVSTLQIYNLGGFTAGDGTVTITVADANDPTCDIEYTVNVPIACPPVNDDCAGAISVDLGNLPYTNTQDASAATDDAQTICGGNSTSGPDVYYSFMGDGSTIMITLNEITGGDLEMSLYSGSCGALSCEDFIDDPEELTIETVDGTNYVLEVAGWSSFTIPGEFEIEIITLCEAATRVALPTATTTALPADACTDGVDGFTYYDDGAGNYIFAIAWDPNGTGANAAAKAAAEVEIRKYTANGTQAGVWEPFDNSATEASFALLTSWNVDLNGSSMTGPVDVKFYYDAAEKADVDAASAAHASANGVTDNGGMWYKNETSDYIHVGQVSAADFSDNMTILTDVAGGATDNGVPYARFDGVTSFSGGAYATGAGAGFLPIEIARFDAKAMNLGNKVMWATASEVQNDYQMIQKSQDGMGGWSEVGRVKSDGDSKELRSYEVMDMDPYATTYYRVYSVDLDGRVQISTVISVERSVSNSMTIYPNPARERATVVVESANDGRATVSIIDITGKLVSTITHNVIAGQNEVTLDLSNLQQGVYSVIYNSADASSVQRLVVE